MEATQEKEETFWKKRGTLIKLDLEKAYDYTDWEFLNYTITRKGFGSN